MADIATQKVEFDGKTHTIKPTVDDNGWFEAEWGGEEYRATSLNDLMEKIREAIRDAKKELAIDCTLLDLVPSKPSRWGIPREPYESGTGVVHAIYRGKHARRQAWLFTDLKGKKFEQGGYSGIKGLCRRLTDAQVKEYLKLRAEIEVAEKALEVWEKKHTVDPKKLAGVKDKEDREDGEE